MRAKVENGIVTQYPYSFGQLRKDNPNVSFPPRPNDVVLETYGSFAVTTASRPNRDVVTEGSPELVNEKWTQVWASRNFNQGETTSRLTETKAEKMNELNVRVDQEIRDYMIASVLPGQTRNKINVLIGRINGATNKNQVDVINVQNGW